MRGGAARRACVLLLLGCGARTPFDGGGAGGTTGAPEAGPSGGGATSAAGSGGTPAHGGHGGASGVSGCGGRPGPAMVAVPDVVGVRCVDATEVSNAHYAAFLAALPSPAEQPAACVGNASFVPPFGWPATAARAAAPVVNVDWCDARAYCAWAGKRLCPGRYAAPSDVTTSAWMAACARGTELRAYPYGNAYAAAACVGKDAASLEPALVGSNPACEGGYPGLLDLSGNVWEWEDACESDAPDARCHVRGGSFRGDAFNVTCAASFENPRATVFDDFGFRCCAP